MAADTGKVILYVIGETKEKSAQGIKFMAYGEEGVPGCIRLEPMKANEYFAEVAETYRSLFIQRQCRNKKFRPLGLKCDKTLPTFILGSLKDKTVSVLVAVEEKDCARFKQIANHAIPMEDKDDAPSTPQSKRQKIQAESWLEDEDAFDSGDATPNSPARRKKPQPKVQPPAPPQSQPQPSLPPSYPQPGRHGSPNADSTKLHSVHSLAIVQAFERAKSERPALCNFEARAREDLKTFLIQESCGHSFTKSETPVFLPKEIPELREFVLPYLEDISPLVCSKTLKTCVRQICVSAMMDLVPLEYRERTSLAAVVENAVASGLAPHKTTTDLLFKVRPDKAIQVSKSLYTSNQDLLLFHYGRTEKVGEKEGEEIVAPPVKSSALSAVSSVKSSCLPDVAPSVTPSLLGFAAEFNAVLNRLLAGSITEGSAEKKMSSIVSKLGFSIFTCFWYLGTEDHELFPFYTAKGEVCISGSVFSGMMLDRTPDGLIATFMAIILVHLSAVDRRSLAISGSRSLQQRAKAGLELMTNVGITVETFIVNVLQRSSMPITIFLVGGDWIKKAFGIENERDPRVSHLPLALKLNGLMQHNLNKLKDHLGDDLYKTKRFRLQEHSVGFGKSSAMKEAKSTVPLVVKNRNEALKKY